MSTNFPGAIDTYTHPNPNDPRSGATSASTFVSNLQDAVAAVETKVGKTSDTNVDSQDYKLSGVTSGDKAMSKTGTETATNKTFTAPKINIGGDATGDMYYRDSGGAFQRLPAGADSSIISYTGGIPTTIPNPSTSDATYAVKGVRVLDANAVYYGADAGGSDAYAITLSPALSAYAVGQVFTFKANTVNTGPATLAINGLAAKTIVKGVNTTLADGDIAAGQICIVEYDGTNFVLQSPSANTTSFLGKFKNGTTTRTGTAASGTQTIAHGLGITPRKVTMSVNGNSGGMASNVDFETCYGSFNGTTQGCSYNYQYKSANGGSNAEAGTSSTQIIFIEAIDSSNPNSQGAVATCDATNITLTWTKVGSGVLDMNIYWEVEA